MKKIFSAKTLQAGLIVGTLDLTAAFIQVYLRTKENSIPAVSKFIASGVFGKSAFDGGTVMIIFGIIFHYIIALSFTFFFFWLVKTFPALLKMRLLTGIVYGIFIWCVMNLIAVPLSNTPKFAFDAARAAIAASILIVCIGIPLAFMAGGNKKNN